MTVKNVSGLSAGERKIFADIADVLIPRYGKMPSASDVGVHEETIDQVLAYRPDLVEAFRRGMDQCQGKNPSDAINDLAQEDSAAFAAISLAASAGYYMNEAVRELIGYPGQDQSNYDPFSTPEYLTNHMLERVVRRGPVYKPTPGH